MSKLSVGEAAISPGAFPALNGEILARVSFEPLTNTKPPNVVTDETPCDTRTRSVRPLDPFLFE
jgi:hypothetical protein